MVTTNEGVGVGIRRARLNRGMTLQDLADAAGVTISTVVNVEKGHTKPRKRTIDALNAVLRVREK